MQQKALAVPPQQPATLSEPILNQPQPPRAQSQREQPCPQCGYPMSDLKGGREAICQNCGFKDSCCY